MQKVFISYSRADTGWAALTRAQLEAAGIKCWMDQSDLASGRDWPLTLIDALKSASAVVVLLTPNSSRSHQVTFEWAFAMGRGILVIPLLFKKGGDWAEPIKNLHHLDFIDPLRQPWDSLIQRLKPVASSVVPTVPDPPEDFRHFVYGNIELPIMPFTGSPRTPFSFDEVQIDFNPIVHHEKQDYPHSLHSVKPFLEGEFRKRYQYTSAKFPSTSSIRIADWEQQGETKENQRGGLRIIFEYTSFDHYLTTNRSLDYKVIPTDSKSHGFSTETIRDAFVRFPYEIKSSVLANPLAVMIAVISRNPNQSPRDMIIIQYRGSKVASYRDRFQVSAAGYVSTAHLDEHHHPNPFITAIEEAKEEISDRLSILKPSDFRLIGLACSWVDMLPLVYGYIETPLAAKELVGDFARDGYEGLPKAIPFDPKVVLSHITEHRWTPDGAFAMCAALDAFFEKDDIEAAARSLPKRVMRDFFE